MSNQDEYSPEEIAERTQRVLRRLSTTPHTTQKQPKERKRGRPRKRVLTPRRARSDS